MSSHIKAAAYKIQTATSTRVACIIYASYGILHFITNKLRLAHKELIISIFVSKISVKSVESITSSTVPKQQFVHLS